MPTALILTGCGRYADPWHPYEETSQLLSSVCADAGWAVELTQQIDHRLAEGLEDIDLLVVNAGDPTRASSAAMAEPLPGPPPAVLQAASRSLEQALTEGMGLLAVHSAAASLRDYPSFREHLGGAWEPGTSWHPPQCELTVEPGPDHPISAGLGAFTVFDERYSDLVVDGPVDPVAVVHDGEQSHVVLWARVVGSCRVVYDSLGHDARSYASTGHRDLLGRALHWLTDEAS